LQRKKVPIGCHDEVKEFHELVDVLSLALRREHVASHVVIIVPLPVVQVYKNLLNAASNSHVGMGASVRVNEAHAAVNA
jgi:hypothetical protein